MGSFELSDRSRRLLATLVREYIETGEPVSSQVLARESGLGVSSATVRNVLAQLEEAGYRPSAAHLGRTRADRPRLSRVRRSAARRPQAGRAVGYRSRHQLRQQADRSPLMDDLLAERVAPRLARGAASSASRSPAVDGAVLQRIEFVPLGGSRVLVVVVSRGNQVTQKVVDADEDAALRRPRAGGQLPQHRVRRPAAPRRARSRARAAAAGAHALRRAAGARAAAGAARRSRSCRTSRRSTWKALASLLEDERRTTACRWPRCARCSR